MKSIVFTDTVDSLSFEGANGLYIEEGLSFRGYEPKTDISAERLSLSTPPRSINVPIVYVPARDTDGAGLPRLFNLLHRATTRDPMTVIVTSSTDGRDWKQRAYVSKVEASSVTPHVQKITATVELMDGWWVNDSSRFEYGRADVSPWLDLPHDAPYDLASYPLSHLGEHVPGMIADSVLLRLQISGAISRPQITADWGTGSNVYAYNGDIGSGETLTVDPLTHSANVNGRPVFEQLQRGAGLNSGSYIFQPIPVAQDLTGVTWSATLSWSKRFNFVITPLYRSLTVW